MGTVQPPIAAGQPQTTRAKCSKAINPKIALVTFKKVFWDIRLKLLMNCLSIPHLTQYLKRLRLAKNCHPAILRPQPHYHTSKYDSATKREDNDTNNG